MAYNSSLTGYPDLVKVLDRALESPKGIRISLPDKNSVTTFKGRIHTFRSLDRKANCKVYPDPDHPMHGRSVYDGLTLRSIGLVVEILKLDAVEFNMEEI